MIIGVDHGNSCIKTASQVFTSGFNKYIDEPPLTSDLIFYEGNYYVLTEKRLPYRRDKTEDDSFYILTLFAIAKEIKNRNMYKTQSDIQLTVGLPPEYYGALKSSFAEYFVREKKHVYFKYNHHDFDIQITKAFVYPQAYPAIYSCYAQVQGLDKLFIVDIGGYTTDILLLRHGRIDMEYCHSLEAGIIKLYNKAKSSVTAKYGGSIDETDIVNILNGNDSHTLIGREEKEIIIQCAENYTIALLDSLSEFEIDTLRTPVLFVGGGALLIKPFILKTGKVKKSDFLRDTRANAQGYEEMAKASVQRC